MMRLLQRTKRGQEARTHLAEHDVLAVEPGGGNGGDKKLAAVGVGA